MQSFLIWHEFSCRKAYKKKCPSYFKRNPKKWNFNEDLIFHRLNAFLDRLNIVLDCCNTTNQFLLLKKVWNFPLKSHISGNWNALSGGDQSKSRVIRANFVLQCKILSDEDLERPFRCLDANGDARQCIGTFFPPTFAKVEIGGLRGKVLTMNVDEIYHQFTEFYGIFGKR